MLKVHAEYVPLVFHAHPGNTDVHQPQGVNSHFLYDIQVICGGLVEGMVGVLRNVTSKCQW